MRTPLLSINHGAHTPLESPLPCRHPGERARRKYPFGCGIQCIIILILAFAGMTGARNRLTAFEAGLTQRERRRKSLLPRPPQPLPAPTCR